MSLKIIGAGVGRTGTLSTKAALEILGYEKCFHMLELFADPDRVKYLDELTETGKTDFDKLFEGYQATVDFPVCIYYKELFAHYPDAKVILNVRDPEKWYQSTIQTIYATKPKTIMAKLKMVGKMFTRPYLRKAVPVFKYNDKALWQTFFENKVEDKAHTIDRFNRHTDEVKATIPKDQLLIFNVKEGWEPLCAFLGVSVPDIPFPRINERKNFGAFLDGFGKTGKNIEEMKAEGHKSYQG